MLNYLVMLYQNNKRMAQPEWWNFRARRTCKLGCLEANCFLRTPRRVVHLCGGCFDTPLLPWRNSRDSPLSSVITYPGGRSSPFGQPCCRSTRIGKPPSTRPTECFAWRCSQGDSGPDIRKYSHMRRDTLLRTPRVTKCDPIRPSLPIFGRRFLCAT